MLIGVVIPANVPLHEALRSPGAQRAIAEGHHLYTNGRHSMLMPKPLPGWYGVAVKVRDLLPTDSEELPPCAA